MGRISRTDKHNDGMTQISISLPKPLVVLIDKMAKAENRNRSNFIVHALQQMVTEFMSKANDSEQNKST